MKLTQKNIKEVLISNDWKEEIEQQNIKYFYTKGEEELNFVNTITIDLKEKKYSADLEFTLESISTTDFDEFAAFLLKRFELNFPSEESYGQDAL